MLAVALLACITIATAIWFVRHSRTATLQKTDLAATKPTEASLRSVPTTQFVDITESAGITFSHNNGARGEKLLPETMGGGCAFFDFDNDGDQDILLINSIDWPWEAPNARPTTCALYRNEAGTFVDVTLGSGLDVPIYGMGVAVGDYDNDGWVDVYITAVGQNRLFRNLGNGSFKEATATAGVGGESDEWSTSAGWFDYDNDGDLDLFVCNYIRWSREEDQSHHFQLIGGGRAYGRPQHFEGTFPYLFRNDGNGKFTDVSELSGVRVRRHSTNAPLAKSLGLTFCDIDSNRYLDVMVANDTTPNSLFRNDGAGHFVDIGSLSGIAFDASGAATGAMGIDVASVRDRQDRAIAIGNFSNEMTSFYVSRSGKMQFRDESVTAGLGPSTLRMLTFGLFFFDYDLDSRMDLFCANGHLEEQINQVQPSHHYEQPPQLFWNAGEDNVPEYRLVTEAQVGGQLLTPMVGRGATYADIDNDGDLDILITAIAGKPRLLRNDQQLGHHWLRVKLVGDGQHCNRDAIGSWVRVSVGGRVLAQQVMPTLSYLSQCELPLTFGLGDSDKIGGVSVHWADGMTEQFGPLAVDQTHILERNQSTEN